MANRIDPSALAAMISHVDDTLGDEIDRAAAAVHTSAVDLNSEISDVVLAPGDATAYRLLIVYPHIRYEQSSRLADDGRTWIDSDVVATSIRVVHYSDFLRDPRTLTVAQDAGPPDHGTVRRLLTADRAGGTDDHTAAVLRRFLHELITRWRT